MAPQDELDLDKALLLLEGISTGQRVKENKAQIKEALAFIKGIQTFEVYAPELTAIQKALVKLSRHSAKHEGLAASVSAIAKQIDDLITAMQARRKRQKREEEQVIAWLSNTTSNPFQPHG